ncbi:MAG: FAD-dependent oxidoreductase [Christensenellaceae bacterium]|nr:FAD-dependent oxidoreductase [Christensenellaceae bacterium]
MKDIIVIGGGPAGCSAAIYAKARGKKVLLFEKDKIGGLIANVSKVSHYVSVEENVRGTDFAQKMAKQLESSGISVKYEEVIALEKTDDGFIVKSVNDEYRCKKVICATGSYLKKLNIDTRGATFNHWPLGNEESLRNKTVVINGGSDGACKEALYMAKFANKIHIVQDQDELKCIDEFKRQIENSNNITVHASSTMKDVEVVNGKTISVSTNKETITDQDGIEVYVQIGQDGNSNLIKDFVEIENTYAKSEVVSEVEGLFFAGDIRVKAVKQIATAVADGCIAGIEACKV